MSAWLESLEQLPRPFFLGLALLMIGGVALAGFRTGWQLRLSFLFLVPISLVSWFLGAWSGVAVSVASALAWLVAALESGHTLPSDTILYWNSLLLLAFFFVFGLLLASLRGAHVREKNLARTDALTGIANRRSFFELAELEIQRAARRGRPMTLAYIDLDDFKTVNDRGGHQEGDRILRLVAESIRQSLRVTDMVARLGGDEFCVLLPETGVEAATTALRKLEARLRTDLSQERWPLTFSVGAIAFLVAPESAESMLRLADELVYSIKSRGKDRFRLRVVETANPDR